MSTQHTPGPWTYESDHTWRRFEIRQLGHAAIDASAFAKNVCTVNNIPDAYLQHRSPEQAEANARLIAAAPELLAALRTCEAFIAKHADNNDLFHPESNTQKALSAARAAIALAEQSITE